MHWCSGSVWLDLAVVPALAASCSSVVLWTCADGIICFCDRCVTYILQEFRTRIASVHSSQHTHTHTHPLHEAIVSLPKNVSVAAKAVKKQWLQGLPRWHLFHRQAAVIIRASPWPVRAAVSERLPVISFIAGDAAVRVNHLFSAVTATTQSDMCHWIIISQKKSHKQIP